MGIPRNLLFDGEELVVALQPHWSFFRGPVSLLAASVLGAVVLAANGVHEYVQLAAVVVSVVSVGWVSGRYARWATTHLLVTTDRIVFRQGLVRRSGLELPLSRVQSVRYRQPLLRRLLGGGELLVEAVDGGVRRFSDVPHPRAVQEEIYRRAHLIERA